MPKTLDGSIISLIILLFIFIIAYNRSSNVFASYKTFIYMVLLNMVLIIVDLFSWYFNGKPGTILFVCSEVFNTLLFILDRFLLHFA